MRNLLVVERPRRREFYIVYDQELILLNSLFLQEFCRAKKEGCRPRYRSLWAWFFPPFKEKVFARVTVGSQDDVAAWARRRLLTHRAIVKEENYLAGDAQPLYDLESREPVVWAEVDKIVTKYYKIVRPK